MPSTAFVRPPRNGPMPRQRISPNSDGANVVTSPGAGDCAPAIVAAIATATHTRTSRLVTESLDHAGRLACSSHTIAPEHEVSPDTSLHRGVELRASGLRPGHCYARRS